MEVGKIAKLATLILCAMFQFTNGLPVRLTGMSVSVNQIGCAEEGNAYNLTCAVYDSTNSPTTWTFKAENKEEKIVVSSNCTISEAFENNVTFTTGCEISDDNNPQYFNISITSWSESAYGEWTCTQETERRHSSSTAVLSKYTECPGSAFFNIYVKVWENPDPPRKWLQFEDMFPVRDTFNFGDIFKFDDLFKLEDIFNLEDIPWWKD